MYMSVKSYAFEFLTEKLRKRNKKQQKRKVEK